MNGSGSEFSEMSEEAVRAATGRGWQEWFTLLDEAGAAQMGHPAIARYLNEQQGVSGWWSQSVTVAYERARGRRDKYETASGFQVSATRTFPVERDVLFNVWQDGENREKWLFGGNFEVRKATFPKSIRASWIDGKNQSLVSMEFYEKGEGRSSVTVQHNKLEDKETAERMKGFWKLTLDRLGVFLQQNP